jgi:hypothetical protein
MTITSDEYASSSFIPHHAKIDQYQIYSLIVDDFRVETINTISTEGRSYPIPDGFVRAIYLNGSGGYDGSYVIGEIQSVVAEKKITRTIAASTDGMVTFQSFSPVGKIPIDFSAIAKQFPARRPGSIAVNDPGLFYAAEARISEPQRASYRDLITGRPTDDATGLLIDSRTLPAYYQGVATSTRKIRWGYYRKNNLETHPNVAHSLDWLTGELSVVVGQGYRLPINNPALGTLTIDNQTAGELIELPNNYPLDLIRVGANLGQLISGWDALYTVPPPINRSRPWADGYTTSFGLGMFPPGFEAGTFWEYAFTSGGQGAPTNAIRQLIESTYIPRTRILAANNDRWNHGSFTANSDPPGSTHGACEVNEYELFYQPNADGSIGSYTMDSPRLLEIHLSLDAGKFALDDLGQPRVTNLGWYIERLGWFVGLRRQKDGKFLTAAQAEKYQRTRLNKPTWPAGQYSDSEWGNRGMAIPYLPASYENGQRQDNQWDLVHDLPQLLQALHDQIDASQGIQHNGEIRIPVGGKVQSYPNQGAMLTDLAMRAIELQAMAEKMLVMDVETSNSVRELFAGIGIPVASKSVPVQIGGKTREIYYPAFQVGKGSILDRLTALAQNIGIILGALMPRNTKDERMNPFERKPN